MHLKIWVNISLNLSSDEVGNEVTLVIFAFILDINFNILNKPKLKQNTRIHLKSKANIDFCYTGKTATDNDELL